MPTVYQKVNEVLPNPIAFEQSDAEKIVAAFNRELAVCYVLYFQVKKHHWLVRGPHWHDIHLVLDEAAALLLKQADYFAERITYLGGIPMANMSDLEKHSVIKPEPAGLLSLYRMLGNDLIATMNSLRGLREVHEVLDDLKDFSDASEIEVFLGEREKFCHTIHFYLEPDELMADMKDSHTEVLLSNEDLAQQVAGDMAQAARF